jgi:hypothetical protein
MKKVFLLAPMLCLFFVLLAGCGQARPVICDICGVQHGAFEDAVAGASSHHDFFEAFTADPYSNDFLRVYVESCWSGSIQPEFRLNFTARYDITELYNTISTAESNVPFGVTFDGETITISTNILGLEEIFITHHEQQREIGFIYTVRRRDETVTPTGYAGDYFVEPESTAEIGYENRLNREHMIQSLLSARACYETIAANIAELSRTPRLRATADEARTVGFIVDTLKSYGHSPIVQSFDWYRTTRDGRHRGGITNMNPLNEAYPMGTSYNVILDIISPYAHDEVFLFVAHHDTIPDCIGAIDNATGVAALLEVVRLINGYTFPFDIRFIFFGAEKYQLMGSRYYVANLPADERERIIGVINIDMIGNREHGELQFATVSGTDCIITLTFRELLPQGQLNLALNDQSDHYAFARLGVPAIMLHHTQFINRFCTMGVCCSTDLDIGHVQIVVELIIEFLAAFDADLAHELHSREYNVPFGFVDSSANERYNFYPINILHADIEGFTLIDKRSVLDSGGAFSVITATYANDSRETYTISLVRPLWYPFLGLDYCDYDAGDKLDVTRTPPDSDRLHHARMFFYEQDGVNNLDVVAGFFVFNFSSAYLDKDGLMQVYLRSIR